jgi:HAD superfamily hydrolase (TIGR01549 family)
MWNPVVGPCRAVIFDFDDTLVVTREVKWAHHREVARKRYGIDIEFSDLRTYWGQPFDALISALYKDADSIDNMRAANRSLEDKYPKRAIPRATSVVRSILNEGLQAGIVSSDKSEHLRRDLRRLNFPIDRMFHIQGAEDSTCHKPHPAVFDPLKRKLDAYGISPTEALYVGDALIDFCAAREAGLGFVGVTTGLVTSSEFDAHGAHTLPSLDDLPPLVSPNSWALSAA